MMELLPGRTASAFDPRDSWRRATSAYGSGKIIAKVVLSARSGYRFVVAAMKVLPSKISNLESSLSATPLFSIYFSMAII